MEGGGRKCRKGKGKGAGPGGGGLRGRPARQANSIAVLQNTVVTLLLRLLRNPALSSLHETSPHPCTACPRPHAPPHLLATPSTHLLLVLLLPQRDDAYLTQSAMPTVLRIKLYHESLFRCGRRAT